MDCIQIQEILSAGIDGEATEAELAEARAHAGGCDECTRFAAGLELLAAVQAPHAPRELVDRLELLAAIEAAGARAAGTPAVALAPRRPRLRFAAVASIAAVVLVGAIVTGVAVTGTLRTPQTATTGTASMSEDRAGTATLAAPEADTQARKSLDYGFGDTGAPHYIASDGLAYVAVGPRTPPASSLTASTTVLTALGTGSGPVPLPAFRVQGEADTLVLQLPDGSLLGFSVPVRELRGRRYALASDVDITAFGVWPMLPARFREPAAPDGSPTFVPAGSDDAGARVYAPTGARTTDGFAVAPGTDPTDPAGGNPGWTWWVPQDR